MFKDVPLIYYLFIFLLLGAFPSRGQEVENSINTEYVVKRGDTLYKLAQDFDLGVDEILRANPDISDLNNISIGEKIVLPTSHLLPDIKSEGIVINLAEPRLYFIFEGKKMSFPISIGSDGKTPTGKTKIASKVKNPSWIPPVSIREEDPSLPEIVPPGPDNPLGLYAFHLDGSKNYKWQRILIHGTNAPRSIGSRVSHGCIRLYPKDIETLFGLVEVGMPVTILNQPIKIGEINNKIYMEVHLLEDPDVVMEGLGVKKIICSKIADCEPRIYWQKVDQAVMQNLGIPVDIGNDLYRSNPLVKD